MAGEPSVLLAPTSTFRPLLPVVLLLDDDYNLIIIINSTRPAKPNLASEGCTSSRQSPTMCGGRPLLGALHRWVGIPFSLSQLLEMKEAVKLQRKVRAT